MSDKDIIAKLLTPVTWTTIDDVDVMGHPDGALDDLLKEAADEIKRLRTSIAEAVDEIKELRVSIRLAGY